MDYDEIRYEVEDGRARVTLARPDKHNAMTPRLLDELEHALPAFRRLDGLQRCWPAQRRDRLADPLPEQSLFDLRHDLRRRHKWFAGRLDLGGRLTQGFSRTADGCPLQPDAIAQEFLQPLAAVGQPLLRHRFDVQRSRRQRQAGEDAMAHCRIGHTGNGLRLQPPEGLLRLAHFFGAGRVEVLGCVQHLPDALWIGVPIAGAGNNERRAFRRDQLDAVRGSWRGPAEAAVDLRSLLVFLHGGSLSAM